MTLKERIAYIKGLADGLALDENKAEVKVINEMLNMLEDVAFAVTDVEDLYDELSQQVDEIDEDLATIEEDFYCDDCEDCDCDGDCQMCDEDCMPFEDEDNPDYEVKCPECDAEIVVDEDTLLEGEISCPNCGNTLEFDFSSLFGEDGCVCGDPDCKDCQ